MQTVILKKELDHDCHLSPNDGCEVCDKEETIEVEVCEFCEGTGEITTDEWDSDAHIYMPVGTEKCICQMREVEDESDQDR